MMDSEKAMRGRSIAAACAFAALVAGGIASRRRPRQRNEDLIEGLPTQLKQLYEGNTDNLQKSALRRLQDAGASRGSGAIRNPTRAIPGAWR